MKHGSLSRREWLLPDSDTNDDQEEERSMTLQNSRQASSGSSTSSSTPTHTEAGHPSKVGFMKDPENIRAVLRNLARQADEDGLIKKKGFGFALTKEFNVDAHGVGAFMMCLRKRGYVKQIKARHKGGRATQCLVITAKGQKFMSPEAPTSTKTTPAKQQPPKASAPPVARAPRPEPRAAPVFVERPTHHTTKKPTDFDAIESMATQYEAALKIVDDPQFKRAYEIRQSVMEFTAKVGGKK